MTPLRLIHSSDLHLGKRFGTFPEDVRGRLVDARHAALETLAQSARAEGAGQILLAGDTFDSETPSDAVRVQALAAIARDPGIQWWLLPGNHDSLRAEPLWDALRRDAPPNLRVLDTCEARQIGPDAFLLPAPLSHRHPSEDPTQPFMRVATPAGARRIGLAHGPTRTFHEEADRSAIIAADRADTAGLDYLALGDWHGPLQLGARTRYSGTPEFDRFRHAGRGSCLVVAFEAGAEPEIRQIETGRFLWDVIELTLAPGLDLIPELRARLPDPESRRNALLRLRLDGLVHLSDRTPLAAFLDRTIPEFGYVEVDLSGLRTEATAGDLDAIAQAGALRAAADALQRDATDASRSDADRRISGRALDRMWSLLHEVE
ncbi:MAG: metallophosphoesterase [Pseudomonadota bacterium]